MKQFKFKVEFDEIDTPNWNETFAITAQDDDTAWELAQNEADNRSYKFGHRHEYTLTLVTK